MGSGDKLKLSSTVNLINSIKGWPAKDADSLSEASKMIFGSPYWDIPPDTYKILDMNETYGLMAVILDEKISHKNRYLAVVSDLVNNSIESDLYPEADPEKIK